MKLFTVAQIKELDAATIASEHISSYQLMERAATAAANRLLQLVPPEHELVIFCGSGNNGGDGLAIARLLLTQQRKVRVVLPTTTSVFSEDADKNLQVLKQLHPQGIIEIAAEAELSALRFPSATCAVDALFGIGLNKPITGLLAEVIAFINTKFKFVVSIDMPSGLYADKSSAELKSIVQCNVCLTFQVPKLAFLLPQNQIFVPAFEVLDIGLNAEQQAAIASPYFYLTGADIAALLKTRKKFSHKGTYGHALLVAGSKGMSGAALIAAEACLRSGAGKLTVHSVSQTLQALTLRLPEAMSDEDSSPTHISQLALSEKYSALCFGPGTGTHEETETVLKKIINYHNGPCVLDADGLNILSHNKTWLEFLKADWVLTPHPLEFERLTEKISDDFDRLAAIRAFARRYQCILVYKTAHSIIALPDGSVYFNSSGNPGLAKAGSGDTLSGLLLGLLARGYAPAQAALIGTFVHGLAADLCQASFSEESMLATDVIKSIPKAFLQLEHFK